MRESGNLEFRLDVSDGFLKTVSAFANYGGGRILFGVDHGGNAVGFAGIHEAALRIEEKINNTISPQPDYRIEISPKTNVLTLTVNDGLAKPYYYRSRAYRRNGSSTVETDRTELSRLILEGSHLSFDELPSNNQNLSFATLKQWLIDKLNIPDLDDNILKGLELCDHKGCFNNAAALFADINSFPGIDLTVYGDTINIIRQRKTVCSVSLLQQYEEAMRMWRDHLTYEEITGALRETVETVPRQAFSEAIARALVQRSWDINAHIRIAVMRNRVEVISPGGLPSGISADEYLHGRVPIPRNPILGNLLYRLQIIERYDTGVSRIRESYRGSLLQPRFDITAGSMTVVLPVLSVMQELGYDAQIVCRCLSANTALSTSQIAQAAGFGKTKTRAILQDLSSKGIVRHVGTGRGSKYVRQS